MYMADLWCACTLCGHPQIQRFYPATPLHALTWARLRALIDAAPALAGYECENCGTMADEAAVRSWMVTWGAADDAGEVVACVEAPGAPARWQLRPHRRLDPQIQPRQTRDPAMGEVLEGCDAELVERALGRPVSIKEAWRALVGEALEEGAAHAALASGLWGFVASDRASALALAEEAAQQDAALASALTGGWRGFMDDAAPLELTTHRDPAQMPGRWQRWMPGVAQQRMARGALAVLGVIAPEEPAALMRRTFAVGRVELEGELEGEGAWMATPHGERYPAPLAMDAVCARALYTGLSPGEAARLTAEEIVGTLLGVWRS
jgi:hypothetical protein